MRKLLVLAFSAFVAQTTEYLPIGLLPQIGHNLRVSEGAVGGLVTSYAWIAALTAVPLTHVTNHWNRRVLFLGLLSVITASNLLAAFSHSYATLAALRVATALTHAVFWSILAVLATRLAPELSMSQATAWVYSGISLSIVGGVPSATAIGQWAGWRIAFAVFAFLGVVAIILAAKFLPSLPGQAGQNAHTSAPYDVPLYGAALVTGLIITSHFCSYTYIVPLLSRVAFVPEHQLPLMLLTFGVAGVIGTTLVGWLDQRPAMVVFLSSAGIVVSQALMLLAGVAPSIRWLEMMLWGCAISALIVSLQSWVLELSPGNGDRASALYVAAFNLGIGAGALIGGLTLSTEGLRAVLLAGMAIGSIAMLSFVLQRQPKESL